MTSAYVGKIFKGESQIETKNSASIFFSFYKYTLFYRKLLKGGAVISICMRFVIYVEVMHDLLGNEPK